MPAASTDADEPPFYHAATMPLGGVGLPSYSEAPGHAELRVLHSTPAATAAPATARTRRCVSQTDHMHIDVGEFPHVVMCPAYGFNGVVEGVITLRKKCTFVTQIAVSVSCPERSKYGG